MPKLGKLLRLLLQRDYRRGLSVGVGAAIEHSAFLRSAKFNTLIDAGANKGQFTLATRALNPRAKVISFEPLADQAGIFRKLFQHDDKVTLVQLALGAVEGESEIHVSRRADSSSLLQIGKLQSEIFPGTEEDRVERIKVVRLDDAVNVADLARPVILKIDVQGFELELLKGAENSLRSIDGIYVEVSFLPLYEGQPLAHEVIGWLSARNFGLAGVFHISNNAQGNCVQADMYFKPLS